jgi:hypothetical protein
MNKNTASHLEQFIRTIDCGVIKHRDIPLFRRYVRFLVNTDRFYYERAVAITMMAFNKRYAGSIKTEYPVYQPFSDELINSWWY